jgi:peroxiredoxin
MTVKPFYLVPLLMLITLALVFNSCEAPQYHENAKKDVPAAVRVSGQDVSDAKPVSDNMDAVRQTVTAATTPAENKTAVSSLPSTSLDYLAPDFSLPTADQRQFSLSSFRGKKVLLVFLSTTCEACLKTMQCLLPVYAAWSRDELEMVFVISGGQFDDVQKWIDLYHVECPVLLDSDGIVLNQYQVKMYPTLYFLTADGHVKITKSGLMDDCSKQLDTLLRQY